MAVILESSAEFWDLARDILETGHALRFRARGGSMWPLIHNEDALTVNPLDPVKICVGDVVFYRHINGRVLVHRVIRRVEGNGQVQFLIQGDAFDNPDGVIDAGQILGKVVHVERGRPSKWMRWISVEGMLFRFLAWLWKLPAIRSLYRRLR